MTNKGRKMPHWYPRGTWLFWAFPGARLKAQASSNWEVLKPRPEKTIAQEDQEPKPKRSEKPEHKRVKLGMGSINWVWDSGPGLMDQLEWKTGSWEGQGPSKGVDTQGDPVLLCGQNPPTEWWSITSARHRHGCRGGQSQWRGLIKCLGHLYTKEQLICEKLLLSFGQPPSHF